MPKEIKENWEKELKSKFGIEIYEAVHRIVWFLLNHDLISPTEEGIWEIARTLQQICQEEKQKWFDSGYKRGVEDEIKCVAQSGEHLDLQTKLKQKLKKSGKNPTLTHKRL